MGEAKKIKKRNFNDSRSNIDTDDNIALRISYFNFKFS